MRVAVVGAGVIGVTSAVAIKKAFPFANVTIYSEVFSPNTTGDGSAGLWSPYLTENTDPEKIKRWSSITYKWMESFWKNDLAGHLGICLTPVYRITTDPIGYPTPFWASIVHGIYELNKNQLKRLSKLNKSDYSGGWHFLTFTFEPQKFLPFLMEIFKSMNGKIKQRKILNLKELKKEGYDVVINCTGIGSGKLINDCSITPIRGQISKVKCPWLFEIFLEDDDHGNYVIPNTEIVILGGTHQNDYDTSVREEDSQFIQKGCERIYPSIKGCQIIGEWVGLRPGRYEVRLEPEIIHEPTGELLVELCLLFIVIKNPIIDKILIFF